MTIEFNCPNCDALIAFPDKHAGKRARCLTCQQILIIPAESHQVPQKIEPEAEKADPIPGFYRALFLDSWRIFVRRENITPLVFIIAAVCFKFFLGKAICCVNYITAAVVWGWLLGFYLNIINDTAFEIDTLPPIYLGEGVGLLWNIIKPFLIFALTLFMALLPFILTLALLHNIGVTFDNLWKLEFDLRLLPQALFILGIFLFPMAILTTAVGRDLTLLRPDYFIIPILKAPLPYLIIAALLFALVALETQTTEYSGAGAAITAAHLALNFALQALAIITMRAIGLFYRHYSCHMPW